MFDSAWVEVAVACVVGAVLSFFMEGLLESRPAPAWKRPLACTALHLGLWLLGFTIEFAQVQRPWFAASIVLAFLLLLVLVSNAKLHSLREPIVFQDFEYFSDAFRHPRLYFPFFGLWRTLLAITAFGCALAAGFTLEPPVTARISTGNFIMGLIVQVLIAGALLWLGHRWRPKAEYDPANDLARLGLLAFLWRYGADERKDCPTESCWGSISTDSPARRDIDLPDLLVVQSESFFDPRRSFPNIAPNILMHFDGLKASAAAHGCLSVPAWGANTVRTEFAFLSGVLPESLGAHRFNPYRRLARLGIPTLPRFLKDLGYRTICIHPYSADFYDRNKVFPLIGIDEFVDIRGFAEAERSGPYVADFALAIKVREILDAHQRNSNSPIFVFVITMENHGPLHLERVRSGEVKRLHTRELPPGCDDLTIYLRHLANADRMVSLLREQLESSPREGWLCFYGDHVPIMPKVYDTLGFPDGQTDYVLWSNRTSNPCSRPMDVRVEELGWLCLQQAGLVSGKAL